MTQIIKTPDADDRVPQARKLYQYDEEDQRTADAFNGEKWIEVYIPSNPDTDYFVTHPDGSFTVVAEFITINGIQFILQAGVKQKVPFSVWDFYQNRNANRAYVPCLQPERWFNQGQFFPTYSKR